MSKQYGKHDNRNLYRSPSGSTRQTQHTYYSQIYINGDLLLNARRPNFLTRGKLWIPFKTVSSTFLFGYVEIKTGEATRVHRGNHETYYDDPEEGRDGGAAGVTDSALATIMKELVDIKTSINTVNSAVDTYTAEIQSLRSEMTAFHDQLSSVEKRVQGAEARLDKERD